MSSNRPAKFILALRICAIRSTFRTCAAIGAVVVAFIGATSVAFAASGDIFNLGSLYAFESAIAYEVNNAGQVVGHSGVPDNSGDSLVHAFMYSGKPGAGGMMRDLGLL